jgi:lauroyl/myristoyl acyltransferase
VTAERKERKGGGKKGWLLAWDACRWLPAPVAFGLGRLGGAVYRRADRRRREALTDNLRQVLGPEVGERELRRSVARGFAHYGRYWIELFRVDRFTRQQLLERVTVEGKEHIDAGLASGRGVVIATAHVGHYDVAGAWLGAVGYPAAVIVEKIEPPALFERFRVARERLGLEVVPLTRGADALAAITRHLRAGKVIALVADRDITRNGVPVTFFGRTARIPAGPAMLALRTGAVLVCAVLFQEPRRERWHVVIHPPLEPVRTGDGRADAVALTQRVATELETLIRQRPEQWLVLSRIWRDEDAAEPEPAARPAPSATLVPASDPAQAFDPLPPSDPLPASGEPPPPAQPTVRAEAPREAR